MEHEDPKKIVEALLFASDTPLSVEAIREALKDIPKVDVREIVAALNGEYADTGRSFSIREIAGGFQLMTDPAYGGWVARLTRRPPDKLTGPALETLAIIAYRQPITRSEIEAVRGVNVDGVLHTLETRRLVRTRGRKDAAGRPILYGTTSDFLKQFGLKSIDELPKLREFSEKDLEFAKKADGKAQQGETRPDA